MTSMLLDISRYAATLQLQCSYMWVIANDPLSTLLPLRHALKDNAPLGSIDLLIKGNISASAMRVSDNNGTVPLLQHASLVQ